MNTDRLRIQYQDNIGRAERLREAIVIQLAELLRSNDVALGVPMESRVKALTSVAEKLERKHVEIESIFEVQDLIGVRIILLFRSDLSRVASLIAKHLDVVSSEDTAARLGESEFGYQSLHFVVRLPKAWLSLPSLADLNDFFVEIQLRTLAQHIWAAASHKLQYKHESGVPPPLRRTINRVSALLETVDLEFERVLDERRQYVAQSHALPAEGEPLNVDNLALLLTEMLPADNKGDNELYADLLDDLIALGVTTPQQLRSIIASHIDAIRDAEAKRVAEYEMSGGIAHDPDTSDRLARGVFFTYVGLAREGLRAEFGDKAVDAVLGTRRRRKKSGPQTRIG